MATPTQEDVDNVIAAYENAKAAKGYADTIKLEMNQITGTDYKMIWTEQYQAE